MNTREVFEQAIKANPRLAHEYFTIEAPAVWSVFPTGVCDSQQMNATGWEGPFVYEIDGKAVEVFGKSALCESSIRGFLKKVDLTEASGSQTKKEATEPAEERVREAGSGLSQDGTLNHLEERERAGIACRRWLARMVDASVTLVLYDLLCGFLLSCQIVSRVEGAWGQIVFPLAFYFVLDALLLRTLKTTLGRSLLGLGLNRSDGKTLTLRDCLSRNLQVWMRGMWFGVLFFIPMLMQYFNVKSRGATSYEQRCSAHVFAFPCRQTRIFVGILILMFSWGVREHIVKAVFPNIVFVEERGGKK